MSDTGTAVISAMTPLSWLLIGLAGIAMLLDWWSVASDRRRLEYFAKPAVLVLIIALPLTFTGDPGAYRGWIIAGLALGLVGDVFLMLDKFIPGAAAFLLGHVAYVIALAPLEHPRAALGLGIVLAVADVLTLGRCIARGAWRRSHLLGGIVAAYMLVIGVVVALGVGTHYWTLVLGTLLFGISDTLLGWGRFVGPSFGGRVLVHMTYHLGQLLIALSVAQVALG